MTEVVIRIEGTEQTIANINMYDMKKKRQMLTVVRTTANAVRKEARSTVPVWPSDRKLSSGHPGDLKSSIRAKYYFQGLGAMVLPFKPKGSHRHLVEYGTRQRRTRSGANRGSMKAEPFMQPAKSSQEGSYNAQMERILQNTRDEV
ncbi:HK97 gp10 family phage protein [Priestia megaterium]|uniref:HK97 gp10 family phage protein n=1 Tax=Priestia megaterium TaxID=1404 RepID=UPI000BEE4F64|nr:HK97 gp10 family phage protein [Priestia megaterium]PED63974.1 hypothetical protein CON20_23695 [Priestia megaterium]